MGDAENFYGIMGFENHYEQNTTKLHRIYITEEGKGKGLGKEAIQFLKNQILEVGDQRIILAVNKQNPSYHFYLSQGFKVYEEGVFDIGNGFVMDDYLMEWNT
ncbi:MAG: GNAT family N-acetyltransferase [Cloacibacterium normanense]